MDVTGRDEDSFLLKGVPLDNLPILCTLTCMKANDDKVMTLSEALHLVKEGKADIAVSGKCLHALIKYEKEVVFSYICGKAAVFARMEPNDKAMVVDTLGEGVATHYKGDTIKKVKTYYAGMSLLKVKYV
jgi:hypothetical protein